MKIDLTQKEAQALLASANEMLDEVSKLDEEHRLSVGWRIMLKDFKSGIKKLTKQYFQQLKDCA
jgi:hypothetical protein